MDKKKKEELLALLAIVNKYRNQIVDIMKEIDACYNRIAMELMKE